MLHIGGSDLHEYLNECYSPENWFNVDTVVGIHSNDPKISVVWFDELKRSN